MIAMTGEISLNGYVLPVCNMIFNISIFHFYIDLFLSLKVGGVKDKILAAYNSNIRTVIIPDLNMKDSKKIPEKIRVSLL